MQKSVGIVGLGIYAPEKIVTNADWEKLVDTSDEWIKSRTGISERRKDMKEGERREDRGAVGVSESL